MHADTPKSANFIEPLKSANMFPACKRKKAKTGLQSAYYLLKNTVFAKMKNDLPLHPYEYGPVHEDKLKL